MVSQTDVASLKWFEEHISHSDSDTKNLKPQSFPEEHKMGSIEAQAQVRTEVY